MQELYQILSDELAIRGYNCKLEGIQDNELDAIISKDNVKTGLTIQRLEHRPFEVNVQVNSNEAEFQQLTRIKKPDTSKWKILSMEMLFIILLGGALLVGIVTTSVLAFTNYFQSKLASIPLYVQIPIVLAFFGLIAFGWIFGLPRIEKRKLSKLDKFNQDVITHIEIKLFEINENMINTNNLKCWSCFIEITRTDKTCPNCNSKQY